MMMMRIGSVVGGWGALGEEHHQVGHQLKGVR